MLNREKIMIIRNTLLALMCLGFIGVGLSMKYERRAERREAAQQKEDARVAAEMALKRARSMAVGELEHFLRNAPYVEAGDATLKVAISMGRSTEHIWVEDFTVTRRLGNEAFEFEARLANAPETLDGLSIGDSVSFSRVQIEDWGLMVDGRGYGYFSVRALLPFMEPQNAAQVSAFLAPDVLPDGWPDYPAVPDTPKKVLEPREAFLAHLAEPPESWDDVMVLVAWTRMVKKSNGSTVGYAEYTWVSDIRQVGPNHFQGIPVNRDVFGQADMPAEPRNFSTQSIKDWGFVEGGAGYGFFTLRKPSVMRSARQEQALTAFLAPEPLPKGW